MIKNSVNNLLRLLISFNIFDIVATKLIVGNDMLMESNPLMAYVISNYGYSGLTIIKAIPLLLMYYAFTFENPRKCFMYLLKFTVVLYGFLSIYQFCLISYGLLISCGY